MSNAQAHAVRMVMCELSRVVCSLRRRKHNMQHMQFTRMCEKLAKSLKMALGAFHTPPPPSPCEGWEQPLPPTAASTAVHRSHTRIAGRATVGRTVLCSDEIPSPAPNHTTKWIFTDDQDQASPKSTVPNGADRLEQVGLFRVPHAVRTGGQRRRRTWQSPRAAPPSLALSVHGARQGPVPRAQVSPLWALPCPSPGVSLSGAPTLSPVRKVRTEAGLFRVPQAVRTGAWQGLATSPCPPPPLSGRCAREGPPNAAETTPRVVLTRALFSKGEGEGGRDALEGGGGPPGRPVYAQPLSP